MAPNLALWKQRSQSVQVPSGSRWPARCSGGQIFEFRQTGEAVPASVGTWASVGVRSYPGWTPGCGWAAWPGAGGTRRLPVAGPPGRRSGPSPAGPVHPPQPGCTAPGGCLLGANPVVRGVARAPAWGGDGAIPKL